MTQKPINLSVINRVSQAARYVFSGNVPTDWFGPSQPLAVIAPPDVAGRKFDYPTGYNLYSQARQQESFSFDDLRALADNCDILRSVIETRKDQMEALGWNIRVKSTDGTAALPTPEQKQRMQQISQFFDDPDKESGFAGWLRQLLEDMFVIDAACIYKRQTLGGDLYALEIMDGATIKILIDDAGRLPVSPQPAYQQILKGVVAADYTREELIYLKHNPRSHKIYGYSHVEQVMITVNILIRRALHQLEYYREGSQPDAFIGLPKEWTQEQILAFQKHFDAMLAGNSMMRRRLRFMPGDFKYQETKAPLLKDSYDEFLAKIICYVFSISPEPFVGQVNRATAETSQQRGVDEGLIPLQRYVAGVINRIIAKDFNSSDLEFAWQDTTTPDPLEAANIDVAYVTAGIKTVDEVRESLGLPKLQKPLQVAKFNPYHLPAGSSDGGQFCSAEEAGQGGNTANAPYDDTNDRADRSYPELAIIGGAAGRAISAVRTAWNLMEAHPPAMNAVQEAAVAETAETAPSDTVQPAGDVTSEGVLLSMELVEQQNAILRKNKYKKLLILRYSQVK